MATGFLSQDVNPDCTVVLSRLVSNQQPTYSGSSVKDMPMHDAVELHTMAHAAADGKLRCWDTGPHSRSFCSNADG